MLDPVQSSSARVHRSIKLRCAHRVGFGITRSPSTHVCTHHAAVLEGVATCSLRQRDAHESVIDLGSSYAATFALAATLAGDVVNRSISVAGADIDI